MKEKNEKYEALKKKAIEKFKRSETLLGKNGAFALFLKEFLESALDAEVDKHLDEGERNGGNLRNDKSKKRFLQINWKFKSLDFTVLA